MGGTDQSKDQDDKDREIATMYYLTQVVDVRAVNVKLEADIRAEKKKSAELWDAYLMAEHKIKLMEDALRFGQDLQAEVEQGGEKPAGT